MKKLEMIVKWSVPILAIGLVTYRTIQTYQTNDQKYLDKIRREGL